MALASQGNTIKHKKHRQQRMRERGRECVRTCMNGHSATRPPVMPLMTASSVNSCPCSCRTFATASLHTTQHTRQRDRERRRNKQEGRRGRGGRERERGREIEVYAFSILCGEEVHLVPLDDGVLCGDAFHTVDGSAAVTLPKGQNQSNDRTRSLTAYKQ
jgi:hypothetical protein